MTLEAREDERWMREALRLAQTSAVAGARPFGAVAVLDGQIVGRGNDQSLATGDPTHHAEIAAIREAARVAGIDALATIVLYSSCEPCVMCAGVIARVRLDGVVFASPREVAASYGYKDVHEPEVSRRVLDTTEVGRCLTEDGDAVLAAHPLVAPL